MNERHARCVSRGLICDHGSSLGADGGREVNARFS